MATTRALPENRDEIVIKDPKTDRVVGRVYTAGSIIRHLSRLEPDQLLYIDVDQKGMPGLRIGDFPSPGFGEPEWIRMI